MMHRSLCKCAQRQRTLRSASTVVGGGRPWVAASSVTNSSMPVRPSLPESLGSQIRMFRTTPLQMSEREPPPTSDAGMVCFNCGEKGHISRQCPNPRVEMEDRVRCYNCGRVGHMSFDCPEPRKNKACYNCGSEEHIARDCPNALIKD
jgi:hypothetical protein